MSKFKVKKLGYYYMSYGSNYSDQMYFTKVEVDYIDKELGICTAKYNDQIPLMFYLNGNWAQGDGPSYYKLLEYLGPKEE